MKTKCTCLAQDYISYGGCCCGAIEQNKLVKASEPQGAHDMSTKTAEQPITKAPFNQFVCGSHTWRNMVEIQRASSCNGVVRMDEQGRKFECVSMKRNSVYSIQTWVY